MFGLRLRTGILLYIINVVLTDEGKLNEDINMHLGNYDDPGDFSAV